MFCQNCGHPGHHPRSSRLLPPDLIIAATGLQHGLTVVTRDTADYAKARVGLVNLWV